LQVTRPNLRALSSRQSEMSTIITFPQPNHLSMIAVDMPMIPAPNTMAVLPGPGRLRYHEQPRRGN